MTFRITGLSPEPFKHLFGLSDSELIAHNVRRYTVDDTPNFPCRVEMRHAKPGETVLLLNHFCQTANTPYKASHAIFVREGAEKIYDKVEKIPDVMRIRLLSLRGFSASGMILDADVVEGAEIEPLIKRLFANKDIEYIHVHNAKRGCYSGRIDRRETA